MFGIRWFHEVGRLAIIHFMVSGQSQRKLRFGHIL